MSLRKILFWMHLVAGVSAGVVILIMCVTGVALTYEKQMVAWADHRDLAYTPAPAGTPRLSIDTLIAKVREATGTAPTAFATFSNPSWPAEATLGREGVVFVNPVTGDVMKGGGSGTQARAFFRAMTDWHRWLGVNGEGRQGARSINDAGNLVFFFIVLSGIYLWFPRKITWQHFRPVVLFRGGLSGKARDFNWHNVIGIWSWLPLVLVVGTGVIISYPWASNLLYSLSGSPIPNQNKGKEGSKGKEAGRRPEGRERAGATPVSYEGLDQAWKLAERQTPDWKSIRLQLTPGNVYSFNIDRGNGGQPQLRSTVAIDSRTGRIVSATSFGDGSTGQKLRSLARFTHTGEVLGVAGQTIAGFATLGGGFLVYTGIALSLRRFFAWRRREKPVVARESKAA